MAIQTIIDNQWATLQYDGDYQYIHHTFHQPMSGEPLHQMLNAGLDVMKKDFGTKWLSDDRKNAQLSPEDVEYALTDWGPRAAQAGWKYWALVVPESLGGRASMTEVIQAFHKLGVHMAIFTDLTEARNWLIEQ